MIICYICTQICQSITREGQAIEYVEIARDTVPAKWTVYSVSPLKFEIIYGGGDRTGELTRSVQEHIHYSSINFTTKSKCLYCMHGPQ